MEAIKLGKYLLHEELGRGGYGVVYRAMDTLLNVERAVKVLHPALVTDPDFIERFKREAQIAAKLEHPHIVPVYDLGDDQGRLFLAMKYMPGKSLKDALTLKGSLPFALALRITRQIASALNYAHEQGSVHRDIKPGNIIFDRAGNAYLNDLGFAKMFTEAQSTSLTASGGIVGTPAYIAPEIWQGREVYPVTDLYSLACVFYEMVTGKVLFAGDSPVEIMAKHMQNRAELMELRSPEISDGLRAVLNKALARQPFERFRRIDDFIKALEHLSLARQAPVSNAGVKSARNEQIGLFVQASDKLLESLLDPLILSMEKPLQNGLSALRRELASRKLISVPQHDQVPYRWKALAMHLCCGLGIYYIDKELPRKWLYPAMCLGMGLGLVLGLISVNALTCGLFLIPMFVYLFGFYDVWSRCPKI
ncbi:MAG: serine/threonine protein kinase [Anaerolineales bacterium]|nr:serine/threonine protein kinase [Anaerolineales bacterium]